jgi:bifunctional ADP-heptose synthase (sugar kinase/adenylyltransferase)
MLTLGELGMMLFQSNGEIFSVPTLARRVADVSGAGDTAIATLAAMMSGGANIQEAVCLANIAAGIVCEVPGIVPITKSDLIDKFDNI